jgi:serine/threonine kinase PknH
MTVFICHSSHDHAAVRSLVQHLQTAHESVWLDQSLIGGEAWWHRILHQIRSCTVFVVALSNSCLQSKPCRAEMDYAKALGLPVLPVIIGDVDSYRIDPIFNVQSVDLRNPDVASGAALIAAVRERAAERKELPDPLPDPPPIPYEFLQRLGVAIDSPEELSPTEQSTILTDLRQALRSEDDETVREDIRRLLRALRRRSEVTHGNVDEIDELLHRYAGAGDSAALPEQKPEAVSPAMLVGEPAPSDGTTEPPKPGPSRRNPKTVAIAAGAGVLIAIIAVVAYMLWGQTSPGSGANKPATSTSPPPPPVPVAALDGLLLSPDQINSAMGATGMGTTGTATDLIDNTASVADVNCRAIDAVQGVSTFGGSGWTAVRRQTLQHPPQGDTYDFYVTQGVASFPSANVAAALFTAFSQRWSDCSNRRYTVTGGARAAAGGPRGHCRTPTAP